MPSPTDAHESVFESKKVASCVLSRGFTAYISRLTSFIVLSCSCVGFSVVTDVVVFTDVVVVVVVVVVGGGGGGEEGGKEGFACSSTSKVFLLFFTTAAPNEH